MFGAQEHALRFSFTSLETPERERDKFGGPGTAFRCVPAYFNHCRRASKTVFAVLLTGRHSADDYLAAEISFSAPGPQLRDSVAAGQHVHQHDGGQFDVQ